MKYILSNAEQLIMDYLWERDCVVKTREIFDYINEKQGKNWKRQTLNTLLIRLTEKDVIIRDNRGFVSAKYSKEKLSFLKSRKLIEEYYNDDLKKFLIAYLGKENEIDIDNFLNSISI